MKYIRKFLNKEKYLVEKDSLESLGKYIAWCEGEDEVTFYFAPPTPETPPTTVTDTKYQVGDYLLSSGEVIKNADYTDQDVIGVCVIPDNFISKEGINSKARFCALTESPRTLKYKTSGTEDGLSKFNQIGCVGYKISEEWKPNNKLTNNATDGYIPGQFSDLFEGQFSDFLERAIPNPYDKGTYWYIFVPTEFGIASPYLYVNGKYVFNEGVYNRCAGDFVSALSDMDGLANTAVINDSDHPAANYCATYNTNGTSVGDWYLPAIGELAFIMPRFDTINSAISKVGGTPLINSGGGYWSSTQKSANEVWYLNPNAGYVSCTDKTHGCNTRQFIRKD